MVKYPCCCYYEDSNSVQYICIVSIPEVFNLMGYNKHVERNAVHYCCSWLYPLLVVTFGVLYPFAKKWLWIYYIAEVIVCVNIGVQYYSCLFHYGHTMGVMATYHCTLQHILHLTLPATVAPQLNGVIIALCLLLLLNLLCSDRFKEQYLLVDQT